LQTCSSYKFAYDHACFLCICLSFGSIFHIWEKTYHILQGHIILHEFGITVDLYSQMSVF
jgi:hypothetical protein